MNIQLFDNKGDIYICIKNAPKGMKEQVEKLFADIVCKELKGLVSEPEPAHDEIVEFVTKSSAERNDNIPFQKKTKNDEEVDVVNNDGFEDITEDDGVPFEGGTVVKTKEPETDNTKAKEIDYDDLFA